MKFILKTIIIIGVLIVVGTVYPKQTFAWDDCPKGMVNDPYPGNCSRYIDTDNNGICDHSEPAPEDRIADEKNNASKDEFLKPDLVDINNNSFPKLLFAVGAIVFSLVGILLYVSYKKSKVRKS